MPIDITRSMVAGVLAELKDTWRLEFPVYKEQQDLLIRRLPASKIRNASYAFKESVPFPKLWDYSQGRTYQGFRDRYIQMGKIPYELTIDWQRYDEMDDLIGDLREATIGPAVSRYLQLPDFLVAEYLNGAAALQPSLLNCYDGAGIVSALDGDGNDRLGTAGGNIITGSGTTISGILHDLAMVQKRILAFKDPTAGKPIFNPKNVDFPKLVAIVPTNLNEVFLKATEGKYLRTDASSVGPESNVFQGRFSYHQNPLLTDTLDWWVVLQHPYLKSFAYRGQEEINSIIADMSNSDRSREHNTISLHTDMRCRLGPWFPGVILKVNN